MQLNYFQKKSKHVISFLLSLTDILELSKSLRFVLYFSCFVVYPNLNLKEEMHIFLQLMVKIKIKQINWSVQTQKQFLQGTVLYLYEKKSNRSRFVDGAAWRFLDAPSPSLLFNCQVFPFFGLLTTLVFLKNW